MDESILSHEERAIARRLREGATVDDIAGERDQSPESVQAAIDRIEEKTRWAIVTLEQSPFVETAVDDLDEDRRTTLRDELETLFEQQ